MDKPTRNRIQRATQAARRLLEEEYREQLEGTFDILLDGSVAPAPGAHLSAAECVVREKLVAAVAHRRAGGMKSAEAVAAYLREAAFTTLNRFVALKMLEARDLVQECVSCGEESSGFKEFTALAPGLAALADKGYRLYIETIFDEIGQEVRVLFDRRDVASLLWPQRQALHELLEILNDPELAGVWGEDETIGWVYQYFNGDDERRKMREESQAPRNSRELAVRNQFFTPRYVVQFLTDNTLGRIWYEMRQGKTRLREECQYLVRRPDEVFLGSMTDETAKHRFEGAIAMAKLLQEGTEEEFPPFENSDRGTQRLIELAACVDGYERHPFEDEVDEEWWPWVKKREMQAAESLAEFSAQDLLDVLFAAYRADHHGGYGEFDPINWRIANEVRRRALESRREDLTQEKLFKLPVFVPFRAKKDPREIRILDPACGSGHFLLYAFDLLVTIYEEAWEGEHAPRWKEEAGPEMQVDGTLRGNYADVERLRYTMPGLILRHNLHGIDIDPRAAQIAALALWIRTQRSFKDLGVARQDRPAIQKTNIVVAEPMPGAGELRREFVATLKPTLGRLVERVFDRMELAGEAGSLLRIEDDIRDAVAEIYGNHGELFREFDEEQWRQAERELLRALHKHAERSTNGRSFQRRLFAEDSVRGLGFIDLCGLRYDLTLMNPPFGSFAEDLRSWASSAWPRTKNDMYAAFVERGIELLQCYGMLGAVTSRTGLFLTTFQRWREDLLLRASTPTTVADLGTGVMDGAMVEAAAYCLEKQRSEAKTVFLQVLADSDKADPLRAAIRRAECTDRLFLVDSQTFRRVPGSPFAYWISDRVRQLFSDLEPFERDSRIVRQGGVTGDDTRFLRAFWEIPLGSSQNACRWVPFAKGGRVSTWYSDYPVVVAWHQERSTFWGYTGLKHRASLRPSSADHYFRPGLTWPLRAARFAPVPLPQGAIFSIRGYAILAPMEELLALAAVGSSVLFDYLFKVALGRFGFPEFVVGVLQKLPLPAVPGDVAQQLSSLAGRAWLRKRSLDARSETSHSLVLPALLQSDGASLVERAKAWRSRVAEVEGELARIQREIDDVCFSLYGVDDKVRRQIEQGFGTMSADSEAVDTDDDDHIDPEEVGPAPLVISLLSWIAGIAFGRLDVRLATGEHQPLPEPGPFDPLPPCSPGMLTGDDGLPLSAPPRGYPVDFPRDGVLVDDPGHDHDLVARARQVCQVAFGEGGHAAWREAAEILDSRGRDLRGWFAWSFFDDHIKRYSRSRRKAPIYWQLATPCASYSVWLYYHRFTRDTLFRVLNDYVTPKLKHEERKLTGLTQEAGPNPSARQRKEIDAQESFVAELRSFRDEVTRVAPLWNPDLNDGVIINFAPLWRLVPHHRPWQKECKRVWDKLAKGDYDWAHLAMHLWPERVVPKCAADRSLAIAHELEDIFWQEGSDGKWHPNEVDEATVRQLIEERTSPAVKAALEDLLSAPTPSGAKARSRKRTRRQAAPTPSGEPAARPRAQPTASVDESILSAVRDAIATIASGAAKSDVLAATGLSDSQWNVAVTALLSQGAIIKTGERRGTRYFLNDQRGQDA